MRRTSHTSMYLTFGQRRLRWPGHVLKTDDEQIPKCLLYVRVGKRNQDRPKFRFKDVCKCELKSLSARTDELELFANDRAK